MSEVNIYASPRLVTDINECQFYHTIDIPEYGVAQGSFDYRKSLEKYFGGVSFTQKRVLEIGTADGFLCFMMEQRGADVVAYDLSDEFSWDIVPYAANSFTAIDDERRKHIRKINNAFWFCHRAFKSRSHMVYGTVYNIPDAIGEVDITTFGAVLLHLRDPFLALQNALRLTRDTVIISEPFWRFHLPLMLLSKILGPFMVFLPKFKHRAPLETWWFLSIDAIKEFLGVLGFEKSEVHFHYQRYGGKRRLHYTIVAHRTQPKSR